MIKFTHNKIRSLRLGQFGLFAAMACFLAAPAYGQGMPKAIDFGPTETVSIQTAEAVHDFTVEVADTPVERARGYMFRDVVSDDTGMLFEFDERHVASIWMKNTSVFLDVLFVNKSGKIIKIEHSAKPYSLRSMTSGAPVMAVLEIAGGQANARGIKAGHFVKHSFFTSNP